MGTKKVKEEGQGNPTLSYPRPKVGLLTLLDPRTEFYEYMLRSGINLKQSNEFQHKLLKKTLGETGGLDVLDGGFASSSEAARTTVNDLVAGKKV